MNIDQIIGKMMGDTSLGEEKAALDQWKSEAEENLKALEEIAQIASLTGELKGYKDYDADKAWETLEASFRDEPVGESAPLVDTPPSAIGGTTKVFTIQRMMMVAAAFVLILGATFFFMKTDVNKGFQVQEYATVLERQDVNLSDGSQIYIDQKTKLRVNAPRTISMKGRAFFDVAKDTENAFTVKMPVGNITVLGTRFTVVADNDKTKVMVEEGSVRYELSESRVWVLKAGDLIEVENGDVVLKKNPDANFNSWKTDRIVFRDNTMTEVIDALSNHFQHSIILAKNKGFKKCNVHSDFINASLEDILNELAQTHGLKYEIRGDQYVITTSKC